MTVGGDLLDEEFVNKNAEALRAYFDQQAQEFEKIYTETEREKSLGEAQGKDWG